MGQCYLRLRATVKRQSTRRQFRHKRFDYTPKRSWKYKDDHVLNQISLRGTEYDSPVWELEESDGGSVRGDGGRGGGGETVLMNPLVDGDSDEEVDTGDIRRGGRLVFVETEEVEEDIASLPQDQRPRTSSSSSQQIGRFEVSDVNSHVENGGKEEGEEGEEEGEEEGDLVEVDLTDKDTARLLADDVT